MGNQVYGNSFGSRTATATIGRIPVWGAIYEKYPSGAFVKKDATNTEGKVIPAGTPVSIASVGGAVTLNATTNITGMTLQDATIGSEGATLDIVTRGEFYESRSEATITDAQKTALQSRILFIKEG